MESKENVTTTATNRVFVCLQLCKGRTGVVCELVEVRDMRTNMTTAFQLPALFVCLLWPCFPVRLVYNQDSFITNL